MAATVVEQVLLSFNTLREMLSDRGVEAPALESLGPEELEHLCAKNIFTIEASDTLNIVYYLNKMRIGEFKSALARTEEEDVSKQHILIFREVLSAVNRGNVLQRFPNSQVFSIGELLFNVTKHRLVPKHVRLSAEDAAKLMESYNIRSKSLLPVIHQTDPVAKYLGLVPGDIVRIKRASPTAARYDYYRLCTA
jgi:DNA-directed RNA polymerase I, II, and III subunit RPABC1